MWARGRRTGGSCAWCYLLYVLYVSAGLDSHFVPLLSHVLQKMNTMSA